MGSTICYDTLIAQAKIKAKTLKSKTEPPEIDQELVNEVNKEKEKYEQQAKKLYDDQILNIKNKYKLLIDAVDAEKELWCLQYTLERFNSEDISRYTEVGIKTTIQKELERLMSNDEEFQKKFEEAIEKNKEEIMNKSHNLKKQGIDKATEESQNINKSKREKRKTKHKKEKELKLDLIAAASEIGKGEDKAIDDYESKQLKSYENYKKTVQEDCKFYGEEHGAKMVQEFNKNIRNTAKEKFETNKDQLAKAKVKLEQVKQTALLKLGAKFGL